MGGFSMAGVRIRVCQRKYTEEKGVGGAEHAGAELTRPRLVDGDVLRLGQRLKS